MSPNDTCKRLLGAQICAYIMIETPKCYVIQLFRFQKYLIKINLSYS